MNGKAGNQKDDCFLIVSVRLRSKAQIKKRVTPLHQPEGKVPNTDGVHISSGVLRVLNTANLDDNTDRGKGVCI